MQFTGTVIYVFCILANSHLSNGTVTLTSANFTVDGEAPVFFTSTPDLSAAEFQYNALVLSQTNLSNTLHTLNITTTGPVTLYVNFDYAIYT